MKDKISLWSIRKAAEHDMFQLSRLNFLICFMTEVISISLLLAYEFFYGPIPLYSMAMVISGFIISETFKSKALLDIVHNRKQHPFSHPFSLIQAFLVQLVVLGSWYGVVVLACKDGNHVFDLFFQLNAHHETENAIFYFLFLALLFLLMRLQFTSLYILEQQCNIMQAIHRSWLLTRHNNWLVERFFLWQLGAVFVGIYILSPHREWNINFAIIPVVVIISYVINIQVRMFKELA